MKLFGIEFLAAVVDAHFLRQRIGNIELDFLARLFECSRQVAGLAGQPRHHRSGFDRDLRMGLDGLNLVRNNRRAELQIGRAQRQLLAPIKRMTAQLVFLFDDHHLITGAGGIQGGRQTGYAATDHQDPATEGFHLVGLGQANFLYAGHAHFKVVIGQHLNAVEVDAVVLLLFGQLRKLGSRMRPDHLLAQIHAIDDTAVEAENIEVDASGTRRDHE